MTNRKHIRNHLINWFYTAYRHEKVNFPYFDNDRPKFNHAKYNIRIFNNLKNNLLQT